MKCNFNTQEYTIVKNLYVRMQITRFFKQGYTMVETENSGVLAAINPKKTELIVSVINTSGKPELFNINCSKLSGSGKKIIAYRTSTTENCIQISALKTGKSSISYDAPSLSLTTFKIPI